MMNLVAPKAGAKSKLLFNKLILLLRLVSRASMSDLSITTKSNQNHIFDKYEFGST